MGKVDPREGAKSYPKLTQSDLGQDDVVICTVMEYEQRTLPNGDMVKELHLEEFGGLPLRLNRTQVQYLIDGFGSDESDDWKGKQLPIEKTTKQGPDGADYDVVWVCAPESWASIFREAGLAVPVYAARNAKTVKPVKPEPKAKARRKSR